MIEIYLLEALCALSEHGTLSAAAEHLHISQPALSRSMKKLEELFGVSLFERTKNRIELNETGKIAALQAERILKAEEEMMQTVRNYDSTLHTVSIGYCTPGPMMEMPMLISELFAHMTVSSELASEQALIQGLFSRKYNMILLSFLPEDPRLTGMYYSSESLYISLIPAHPAAVFRDQGLHFKDMNGETFVMVSEVGKWKELTDLMMPDSKLVLQNNLDSLNEIIMSSSLPAFATDLTIRLFRSSRDRNRIFIPVLDPEATMNYYCVCLKESFARYEKLFRLLQNRNTDMPKRKDTI